MDITAAEHASEHFVACDGGGWLTFLRNESDGQAENVVETLVL